MTFPPRTPSWKLIPLLLTLSLVILPVPAQDSAGENHTNGTRKAVEEGKITLALDNTSVEKVIKFIGETTGKIVMPINPAVLKNKKITLFNTEMVDTRVALDLVFEALRLNGVGVIERDDIIIIDLAQNLVRHARTPVIGADESIMNRIDTGVVVVKVFKLEKVDAEGVGDKLRDHLPEDATLTVDANSNKLLLHGDIGLCQHLQLLIDELDEMNVVIETRTFRLAYADAQAISDNIMDLYEGGGASVTTGGRTTGRPRTGGNRQPGRPRQTSGGSNSVGPIVEMRITVSIDQNAVTVSTDRDTMKNIAQLITEEWDLPRPPGTSKVYYLKHSDPIELRDMLREVLGAGGTGGAAAGGRGGRGTPGGASATQSLSGIYTFDAYTEKNAIVAICKTEQAFDFLDQFIDELDQPSTIGLPEKVTLKYVDAVEVAEVINVLLAEAGGNSTMDRPDSGLSGAGIGGDSGGGANTAESGGRINFPWATGRAGGAGATRAPETPMIGRIRVVPIIRENAIAIVAPIAYRHAMRELIREFDQPVRQVMISAVIAEVQLTDDLALGLRIGSGVAPSTTDNTFTIGTTGVAQQSDFLSQLFDTSTLDANFSINAALQALSQETDVRVLQSPRIFTADNQEAYFFDGQEVPFITSSNTVNIGSGTINQSFDYRDVGVVLNARPRITASGAVNMEINLELSAIAPGGATLFGGFILDRRQTHTIVTIKDGQTIVLSGIFKDRESKIKRKIPLLGDIPLLGALFTSVEDVTTTSELLVFITPRVINSPDENDAASQSDLDFLKLMQIPLDEMKDRKAAIQRLRERMNQIQDFDNQSDVGNDG